MTISNSSLRMKLTQPNHRVMYLLMGVFLLFGCHQALAAAATRPLSVLANPSSEYLVYQPVSNASFTISLVANTYKFEWFNPASGLVVSSGSFVAGTGSKTFIASFPGDAVLYLASRELSKQIQK